VTLFTFDADYVDRLSAGDPATENHFHEYFGELIFIKLRARKYPREAIDDIRQETFLRVVQALRRKAIQDPKRIGAFVNSVCNHVAQEYRRADARHPLLEGDPPPLADTHPGADGELMTRESQEEVRAILRELSDKNRLILTALYLDEQPLTELCRTFQVDSNYVRVLVFRARSQFRNAFEKRRRTAAGETDRN
jgi:RNA polymerase sigma-70 factor (ECF subfamily)